MNHRLVAGLLCGGVMLSSAFAAIVVNVDMNGEQSRLDYQTFDYLVGGAGIVAATCAGIACFMKTGWARVPLVLGFLVSAIMADARLGTDGGDAAIDLTPLFLPPVVFAFGAVALIALALAAPEIKTAPRDVGPDQG